MTVSEGLTEAIRKAEARLEEIAATRKELDAEEANLRKMLNQPEPRRRHRRKQVEEAE